MIQLRTSGFNVTEAVPVSHSLASNFEEKLRDLSEEIEKVKNIPKKTENCVSLEVFDEVLSEMERRENEIREKIEQNERKFEVQYFCILNNTDNDIF